MTENYRLVSLTSMTGKIMVNMVLGVTEKHLKDDALLVTARPLLEGKVLLDRLIFLL